MDFMESFTEEEKNQITETARGYGYVGLFATAKSMEEGFDYLKDVLSQQETDKLLIITAYQRIINKLAISLAILQKRYNN